MIKITDHEMGELSGWAQSNPKGPLEREARGPLLERKDKGSRVRTELQRCYVAGFEDGGRDP